jgi:UDP-N-acetylmuramyl tripeptide synthase
MNRVQQIQRWRRHRRASGGPRIGRWLVLVAGAFLLANVLIAATLVLGAGVSAAAVYNYFARAYPICIKPAGSLETVKIDRPEAPAHSRSIRGHFGRSYLTISDRR